MKRFCSPDVFYSFYLARRCYAWNMQRIHSFVPSTDSVGIFAFDQTKGELDMLTCAFSARLCRILGKMPS